MSVFREAWEALVSAIGTTEKDLYGNQNNYRAKIITPPFAFSGPAAISDDPAEMTTEGGSSKWVCFVRFEDPNMPHQKFLDDPCDQSTTPDPASTALLTALHTKMIISLDEDAPAVQFGDHVFCDVGAGDNNMKYDIQFSQFTGIENKYDGQPELTTCDESLIDKMAYGIEGLVGDDGGSGELGITDIPLDPIGVTLHYTNSGTAQDAINTLKKKGYAYHYIIERNGAIVTLAEPNVKVNHDPETNSTHVGVAFSNLGYGSDDPAIAAAMPGKYGSPPIEQWITGPDPRDGASRKWEPYTTQQISAAVTLLKELKRKYPGITADNIKEHSETAAGRKPDGGPALTPHVKEFKRAVA